MSRNIPLNKNLYEKVKLEAKSRFKVYPSAYANGWLVKEYKRRGGTYSGKKTKDTGLSRWYNEKWINVCELPRIVRCGRSDKNIPLQIWIKQYPYCRPYYKITEGTPKIVSDFSQLELKQRCKRKRKNPLKRLL
jgi:hypothetical protein